MSGNRNSTRTHQMIMVGDVHLLRRLNCYPKFYRNMINIYFLCFIGLFSFWYSFIFAIKIFSYRCWQN